MDIFFDSEYDDTLYELVEKDKVFGTLVEVACFAAVVGLDYDKISLINKGRTARGDIFYKDNSQGLVYLVGIYKTKGLDCLREENTSWELFQKAVTSGMKIISSWFYEHPTKEKHEVILLHMLEVSQKIKELKGNDSHNEEISDLLL